MQLLTNSLHILLTCSFVLVLAYLLSLLFSSLASSLFHGPSAKSSQPRATPHLASHRPGPAVAIHREQSTKSAVMDRLQEEDEEDEDPSTHEEYAAAATGSRTPGLELADNIFHDGLEDELPMDEFSIHATEEDYLQNRDKGKHSVIATTWCRSDGEGKNGNGELDEEGNTGSNGELDEADGMELYTDAANKQGGIMNEEEDDMKESSDKLGNVPPGSSSPQQRLPPTWSDLERMVNIHSKKDLLAPTQPVLLEE